MKKVTVMTILVSLALVFGFQKHAHAEDLLDVMKEMGDLFTDIRKSIQKPEDLNDLNRVKSQKLSELLHRCIPMMPKLDQLSNDPIEQQRLLTIFRKIMSETLAVSFNLETQIVTKNLNLAKANIEILVQKRKEAHDLFRK